MKLNRLNPQGTQIKKKPAESTANPEAAIDYRASPLMHEMADLAAKLNPELASQVDPYRYGLANEMANLERQRSGRLNEYGMDPMHSGTAEAVSPMRFVSPVGDLADLYESGKLFAEGIGEGDLGKTGAGLGLSLASAAMAFAPGNLSMLRSWGDQMENPVFSRLAKSLEAENANIDDVYRSLNLNELPAHQRRNAGFELEEFLRVSNDPDGPLGLSVNETNFLEEISEGLKRGELPSSVAPSPKPSVAAPRKEMPKQIGNPKENPDKVYNLSQEQTGEGSYQAMYKNYKNGDYMSLNIDPIVDAANEGSLRGTTASLPKSLVEKYPERSLASMNMEINDPYYAGRIWGEMFSHVRKGDISLPGNGSLSTDSYGLVMKQVERGLAGKPGRGVKKLDLPDEDLYQYRVLNNMGHKNNTFSMPEEMWGRVKEEGLLAYNGTLGAKSFKNGGEANEYLKNVVENHVNPYLKKHGMPPARMVSADDFSDALKVEFPYPFIEKLRKGGKLPFRLNKKRKKGMSTSRR